MQENLTILLKIAVVIGNNLARLDYNSNWLLLLHYTICF